MRTFNDAAGRTWTIAINIGSAMRVRDRLGVDLLKPAKDNPSLITRLGEDEILLAEVIACLLEPQFEAHKVTEKEVYESFDGDTQFAAFDAFYQELVDFFQKRRPEVAEEIAGQMKIIQKELRLNAAKVKYAESRIDEERIFDAIRGRIDTEIDKAIRGVASGSLQEQPESTPAL